MVMKLTPNLEETTVQGFDIKCFLIGSPVMFYLFYLNHTQWYSREHKKYNGLEGKQ